MTTDTQTVDFDPEALLAYLQKRLVETDVEHFIFSAMAGYGVVGLVISPEIAPKFIKVAQCPSLSALARAARDAKPLLRFADIMGRRLADAKPDFFHQFVPRTREQAESFKEESEEFVDRVRCAFLEMPEPLRAKVRRSLYAAVLILQDLFALPEPALTSILEADKEAPVNATAKTQAILFAMLGCGIRDDDEEEQAVLTRRSALN